MDKMEEKKLIHKAFFATVIVNGCIAVADLFAGFFFLFEQKIVAMLYLHRYPFSSLLQTVTTALSAQNQMMGIIYFFSHGIVKITLVWGLLTNRLWAYPLAIVLLGGFSLYQIYDLLHRFSWFTILLLVVNVITIFFISREYRDITAK